VSGPIGLHGGGEFMPGDEPFLLALLEAAPPAADGGAVSVVVVPTAAARHRPDATARHGREAIERVAAGAGRRVNVETALIVDTETANDPVLADRLATADVIYLPGGDPDLLPGLMRDSLAWRSIRGAHARGAVIAGACAGAMALGPRTWTPHGWLNGLGLVHGLVVVPHYDGFDPRGWESTLVELNAAGLGYLGIDERTGVLSSPNGTATGTWRVIGPGRVEWFPFGGQRVSGTSGATIPLPG
jgi:cyanophycinase-like exopeptidase